MAWEDGSETNIYHKLCYVSERKKQAEQQRPPLPLFLQSNQGIYIKAEVDRHESGEGHSFWSFFLLPRQG